MSAKPQWGYGPWDNEPDTLDWDDEATGLHCYALRNALGSWCGYVAVPIGHRWHGLSFDDLPDLDVHGGLTFNGERLKSAHPAMYWIGFDCAHRGDRMPFFASTSNYGYRDLRYVKQQCAGLARQIKETQG